VPTYQYRCTACGEPLEAVQGFHDDPLTVCPVCGGALRKVFSSVGVVFKGSGFYRTDSRKEASAGTPAAAGGTAGESSKPAAGDASKPASTDAKPAATPAGGAKAPASSTPSP